jgi:hypothetical protein
VSAAGYKEEKGTEELQLERSVGKATEMKVLMMTVAGMIEQ